LYEYISVTKLDLKLKYIAIITLINIDFKWVAEPLLGMLTF